MTPIALASTTRRQGYHQGQSAAALESSPRTTSPGGVYRIRGDSAEAMGVAQQTLAHYEAGRLRLLAGALPTLADQLGVTVEDLITTPKRSVRKCGPVSKLRQQLERINALPKAQQRFVMQMLNRLLKYCFRVRKLAIFCRSTTDARTKHQ